MTQKILTGTSERVRRRLGTPALVERMNSLQGRGAKSGDKTSRRVDSDYFGTGMGLTRLGSSQLGGASHFVQFTSGRFSA